MRMVFNMNIPNNILKHYLQNVYFFCGTACGGKTTISKAFADKHDMMWLSEESLNKKMADIADPAHQPAWCSRPADWETYFNRPFKEYHQWLSDCGKEMLSLELIELIGGSANRKIAADIYNMPPKMVLEFTEPNRVVFLAAASDRVVRDYFNRPGHTAIYDCIMRLGNPRAALENCYKTLTYGNQIFLDELYQSGLYYIMRDENSTVEDTLALVEKHFGINGNKQH